MPLRLPPKTRMQFVLNNVALCFQRGAGRGGLGRSRFAARISSILPENTRGPRRGAGQGGGMVEVTTSNLEITTATEKTKGRETQAHSGGTTAAEAAEGAETDELTACGSVSSSQPLQRNQQQTTHCDTEHALEERQAREHVRARIRRRPEYTQATVEHMIWAHRDSGTPACSPLHGRESRAGRARQREQRHRVTSTELAGLFVASHLFESPHSHGQSSVHGTCGGSGRRSEAGCGACMNA